MIRKFLLSTIAVFGFSGVASAADLAVKAAPYVAPTYDWSGFYLGGFVGGGWSHDDASEPDLGIVGVVLGAPPVQTTSGSSFIGGIEVATVINSANSSSVGKAISLGATPEEPARLRLAQVS
jgi:opacity protein-like surface antigen